MARRHESRSNLQHNPRQSRSDHHRLQLRSGARASAGGGKQFAGFRRALSWLQLLSDHRGIDSHGAAVSVRPGTAHGRNGHPPGAGFHSETRPPFVTMRRRDPVAGCCRPWCAGRSGLRAFDALGARDALAGCGRLRTARLSRDRAKHIRRTDRQCNCVRGYRRDCLTQASSQTCARTTRIGRRIGIAKHIRRSFAHRACGWNCRLYWSDWFSAVAKTRCFRGDVFQRGHFIVD